MSVCRMEQLGFHWTNSNEILQLMIYRKSVAKTEIWLKYDKNNRHITLRSMNIYDNISLNSSQNVKIFIQICRENKKRTFYIQYFF